MKPEEIAKFSEAKEKFCLVKNKPITELTLALPGAGCSHAKCTMCSLWQVAKEVSGGSLFSLPLLKKITETVIIGASTEKIERLLLFCGGSLLNPKEIDPNYWLWFANYIHFTLPNIKEIMLESRCEYINSRNLESLKKLNNKLTIGIGLESANNYVRNYLIKKDLSWDFFQQKLEFLNSLGIKAVVYVFLKPTCLSEKDSLEDVLKTLEIIGEDKRVKRIVLTSAFVQEGSYMACNFYSGNYLPPWLWTILEIVKEVKKNNLLVEIAGFSDIPPPIAIPTNYKDDGSICSCSEEIYCALEELRTTGKIGSLPNCQCKNTWEKIMI